jgi:hypothetical protein
MAGYPREHRAGPAVRTGYLFRNQVACPPPSADPRITMTPPAARGFGVRCDPQSGLAKVTFAVDGGQNQTATQTACTSADNRSQNASFTFDTRQLTEGSHTIIVTATDRAGNEKQTTLPISSSPQTYATPCPTDGTADDDFDPGQSCDEDTSGAPTYDPNTGRSTPRVVLADHGGFADVEKDLDGPGWSIAYEQFDAAANSNVVLRHFADTLAPLAGTNDGTKVIKRRLSHPYGTNTTGATRARPIFAAACAGLARGTTRRPSSDSTFSRASRPAPRAWLTGRPSDPCSNSPSTPPSDGARSG